jgi:hypothetical protein
VQALAIEIERAYAHVESRRSGLRLAGEQRQPLVDVEGRQRAVHERARARRKLERRLERRAERDRRAVAGKLGGDHGAELHPDTFVGQKLELKRQAVCSALGKRRRQSARHALQR